MKGKVKVRSSNVIGLAQVRVVFPNTAISAFTRGTRPSRCPTGKMFGSDCQAVA
jgi:hypothetical protein